MEIPSNLKTLYRHWPKHLIQPQAESDPSQIDLEVLNNMIALANERMSIWYKKINNQPKPWTKDQHLRDYRFCNTYRELDRQTIEFHELLMPLRDDFDLWFLNMLFCRLVCKPETIRKVGLLSFEEKENEQVFNKLLNLPSPKYGNAYIFPISLIQRSDYPTREKFFCFYLPEKIKEVAKVIKTLDDSSIVDALEKVLPVFGFNLKFHFTETLIDTAYQFPDLLNLLKEFPIGPGSIPTMKRLNSKHDPQKVCLSLINMQPKDFNYLTFNGERIYLSAENWEGVGCEFRKYTNLKSGGGRRRKFV
jgi:hypothetical protein